MNEDRSALARINRLLDEVLGRLDRLEHEQGAKLRELEERVAHIEADIGINDREGRAALQAKMAEIGATLARIDERRREETDEIF